MSMTTLIVLHLKNALHCYYNKVARILSFNLCRYFGDTRVCFQKNGFVTSICFLQAVVHKKAGGQAQKPVHYGHVNKEEDDSREY